MFYCTFCFAFKNSSVWDTENVILENWWSLDSHGFWTPNMADVLSYEWWMMSCDSGCVWFGGVAFLLHVDVGGDGAWALQVLGSAGVGSLVHLPHFIHLQDRLQALPAASVQLHRLRGLLRVERPADLKTHTHTHTNTNARLIHCCWWRAARFLCDSMLCGLTFCPGYSHVKSTATSCSPTTVHESCRFTPTATEEAEAWITGTGGAAGSGPDRGINRGHTASSTTIKANS